MNESTDTTKNGQGIEIIKVTILNGKMKIDFGKCNLALISHAVILLLTHLQNLIIAGQQPEQPQIEAPGMPISQDIINKIRGN